MPRALGGAVAFLVITSWAHAATVSTADGAGADTYIRFRDYGPYNFGGDDRMVSKWDLEGINSLGTRRMYFRFDLSSVSPATGSAANDVAAASIDFTFASATMYPITYNVYGLTDGLTAGQAGAGKLGEDFGEMLLTADNAPATSFSGNGVDITHAALLGSFSITGPVTNGVPRSFTSAAFVSFLNADTNNLISLIIAPQTQDNHSPLEFRTKEYPTGGGPGLNITPVPEAAASALIVACVLPLLGRRRVSTKAQGRTNMGTPAS